MYNYVGDDQTELPNKGEKVCTAAEYSKTFLCKDNVSIARS